MLAGGQALVDVISHIIVRFQLSFIRGGEKRLSQLTPLYAMRSIAVSAITSGILGYFSGGKHERKPGGKKFEAPAKSVSATMNT